MKSNGVSRSSEWQLGGVQGQEGLLHPERGSWGYHDCISRPGNQAQTRLNLELLGRPTEGVLPLQDVLASEMVLHSTCPSSPTPMLWGGLRVRAGIASGVEAGDVVLNKQRCVLPPCLHGR